jgi:hypothetical protein
MVVAMYVVPIAAYYCVLHLMLGTLFGELDVIAAILIGIGTVLGISLIISPGEWKLMQRGATEIPDGARVAIFGTLQSIGPPLVAPISRTACVAYSYNIYHRHGGAKGKSTVSVPHIVGQRRTPSSVHSEIGSTALHAFPMTEGFASVERSDPEWVRNAEAYVAATQFREAPDGAIADTFARAAEMLSGNGGEMRRDTRFIKDEDIGWLHISEIAIPIGEEVCAIGHYSADQRALIADRQHATRLIRGNAHSIRRAFFMQRIVRAFFGVILAAAPNAALFYLLVLQKR